VFCFCIFLVLFSLWQRHINNLLFRLESVDQQLAERSLDSFGYSLLIDRPINEYAGSCIEVARFQLSHNLDLELGKTLMERVAASNSEHVAQAAELLKKIATAMNVRTRQGGPGPLGGEGTSGESALGQ
jgi:hypothetical protein